jgi:hypothetical protein
MVAGFDAQAIAAMLSCKLGQWTAVEELEV